MQTSMIVSPENIRQYHEEGFFILESVMNKEQVQGLLDEAPRFLEKKRHKMASEGVSDNCFAIFKCHEESEIIRNFVFSDLMYEITKAVLGDNVRLYWEQYLLKAPLEGRELLWHQDSFYVGREHHPYLACWCALDDMMIENGTMYVLPYSRDGRTSKQQILPHVKTVVGQYDHVCEVDANELGDPVIIPSGSILCFSSMLVHRSVQNTTNKMRHAYIAQYSIDPIETAEGEADGYNSWFIRDGKRLVFPSRTAVVV